MVLGEKLWLLQTNDCLESGGLCQAKKLPKDATKITNTKTIFKKRRLNCDTGSWNEWMPPAKRCFIQCCTWIRCRSAVVTTRINTGTPFDIFKSTTWITHNWWMKSCNLQRCCLPLSQNKRKTGKSVKNSPCIAWSQSRISRPHFQMLKSHQDSTCVWWCVTAMENTHFRYWNQVWVVLNNGAE